MIARLFIPGIPKNSNARGQWARYSTARNRKTFRQLAAELAEEQLINSGWEAAPFTTVIVRHVSPVRRRRDPSGVAERLKGPLDGLVDAGVIPDDDEEHIELFVKRSIKGPVAGLQLTLAQKEDT